jgi:hypothetical protein
MRIHTPRIISVLLAAGLVLALALPATAGQIITYRGRTSQDRLVEIKVLKRDSGRRFLRSFYVRASAPCDDDSVLRMAVGVQPRPVQRLGEMGEFELGQPPDRVRLVAVGLHAVGVVEFRQAAGTAELVAVESDAPGRTCETGELDWSAERRGIRPAASR